jgi:arylsulfatase A-like enzyme
MILDRDTWIFFFSDHGDMHGSHGQFKKNLSWQESSNVPFLVWGGPAYRPMGHYDSAKIDDPINHVDILPTSLGLAGIEVPKDLPGFDDSGLLRGEPVADRPDSAYLQNVIPTATRTASTVPTAGHDPATAGNTSAPRRVTGCLRSQHRSL